MQLLASTEVDQVQAAACSALGRIMRFRPSLISAVAVNGGQTLRKILEIHDPRLQARSTARPAPIDRSTRYHLCCRTSASPHGPRLLLAAPGAVLPLVCETTAWASAHALASHATRAAVMCPSWAYVCAAMVSLAGRVSMHVCARGGVCPCNALKSCSCYPALCALHYVFIQNACMCRCTR